MSRWAFSIPRSLAKAGSTACIIVSRRETDRQDVALGRRREEVASGPFYAELLAPYNRCMTALIFAAAAAALFWIAVDVRVLRGVLAWREPEPAPADRTDWPTVAMVVPARNEERNLAKTVPTLLAQDYPKLTITFVDDNSEDRTGDILRQFAATDSRVRVIAGRSRPAGWVGKPWALAQGIETVQAEWLLLVDADITLDPAAVRIAVAEAEAKGVDMYSLAPIVDCRTLWQQWTCLAMATTLVIAFPMHQVNNPKSKLAIAAGGFVLIRRNVHAALGGEEAVRNEIAEDVRRAERLKAAGYRLFVTLSRHLAITPWYGTLGEIWTGLRKNYYAGLYYNPWLFIALSLFGEFIGWMPVVATIIGALGFNASIPSAGLLLACGLTGWIAQGFAAAPMIHLVRAPWWQSATMPVAFSLYHLIGCTSVFDYHFGGGPKWKNRSFDPSVVKGQGS